MKILLLLIICLIFFSFAINLPNGQTQETTLNAPLEIAIADFLQCKLSKNHKVFSILIDFNGEYAPYKIDNDIMTLSILPEEAAKPPYCITQFDTIGSVRLPTRHIIKNGKLFYWHDPNYGLTGEMIRVLLEYNVADSVNVPDRMSLLWMEGYNSERTKAANYYFCKKSVSKYKRVITSIGLGYYKPPKLKCN